MGNEEIKLVDKYRYLGCVLTEHLSYKAVGDLLYNSCVFPTMEYCSAVWGYEKNENFDRIHHRAIPAFLDVLDV